jgi:hypothetical protein
MILLTLALLGFAVADLVTWSPEEVSRSRQAWAGAIAVAVVALVAALAGLSLLGVVLTVSGTGAAVAGWLVLTRSRTQATRRAIPALAWMLVVLVAAFALSGLAEVAGGSLGDWYRDLAYPFVTRVPLDQSLLAVSVGLFLLASGNQVVRLVLEASGTPATRSESTLKGGRVLGPMERLFVAAMVVSGSVVAGAALIAAKGLLRLPEIRSEPQQRSGASDQVTEYFLIGTLSSVLLAAALGAVISAAG